nr:immunoglobulin light chain junction region [Macaca mulatta]
GQQESYWPTF